MNRGDIVENQAGDRGEVRRVGERRVRNPQTFIFADPVAAGPTFEKEPDSVMVEWSTVDGKPVRLMASWVNVADLTLIEAAQPVAPPAGE